MQCMWCAFRWFATVRQERCETSTATLPIPLAATCEGVTCLMVVTLRICKRAVTWQCIRLHSALERMQHLHSALLG
jgi:hypothetical protein